MSEVDKLKEGWSRGDNEEIDLAINALTQHRHGRRALWWLLQIGQVGTQPFNPDPQLTAFNCGQLNVGQQILDRLIHVSPDGYIAMMKENADEQSERDNALTNAYAADTGGRSYSDPNAYSGPGSD